MAKKKKILIVDSDLPACRAYQKLLEKKGFEATCCLDGREALKKAYGSYDCILIDTSDLPKVDGWEVVVKLKNHDGLRKIPLIVITALEGDHWREKANKVGADSLIAKFSPDQVLEEIEKILRGGS
jgi:CheY-like chemotaxis protein